MNKIILISLFSLISFNSMAELGKLKITKETKKETRESIQTEDVEIVNFDLDGNKLLTLEEVYKKYGDGEEAQKYIKVNEMFDQIEERNKKMQ